MAREAGRERERGEEGERERGGGSGETWGRGEEGGTGRHREWECGKGMREGVEVRKRNILRLVKYM